MKLSVVLPVYNEEELLGALYDSLTRALASIGDYSLVFVDDGSTDGTSRRLEELAARDPKVVAVFLSRNFGNQVALSRGLEHADGDRVVVMDSDLEDRPEDIPKLLDKAAQGYDVVYAVRGSSQKTWLKDLGSRAFYWLIARVSDMPLPRHAGNFCVMSRDAVEAVKLLPERHRYFSGLRAWVGFRQAGLELPRGARPGGTPKQTYRRLLRHALDAVFSFSTFPLRALSLLGLAAFAVSLACAAVVVFMRFYRDDVPLGWASTILMVIFLGGIQLIGMGVLGEYLARIYDEVRGRPATLVRRVLKRG